MALSAEARRWIEQQTGGTIVCTEPVMWHPVPDNAVILGVFSDPLLQPTFTSARFHWRIAP